MGGLKYWRCYSIIGRLIYRSSNDNGAAEWLPGPESPRKGIIMNVARSFNNWRKYRQTVNELDRMTTRELRDLGIERSEIKAVARAAVGF